MHIPSISVGNLYLESSLLGMSSRTYQRIPPPFLFLSSLYGLRYPSIRNCDVGKVSSSFVSTSISISILPIMKVLIFFLNLFEIEFTFKVATINLLILFILFISFSSLFSGLSLLNSVCVVLFSLVTLLGLLIFPI